ncbi:hypothetical protein RN001_010059 [Aquatica leii]|uniref:Pre-rRNA-processing protein RIX1 N-terminal domain-containing protein n=1 Tax=Aquatica leii TaxID=1421715 RepID=A0AAN7P7E5_9COLE|nr:hypothetical protein RN001_010059 [Aquatica leii]
MVKTKVIQQLEQLVKGKAQYPNVTETIKLVENLYVYLCYKKEANEIVVSYINKLLNTSETRAEGLKLLNSMIFKIPQQFVLDNYLSWIPMLLSITSSDETNNEYRIQIIVKIIQICKGTQEFDKFLVNNLQKLIQVCLTIQSNSATNETTLHCIRVCIEKYPSSCIPSKSKLEESLSKYIMSDAPKSFIKDVGTTCHLLLQIAGSSANNINQQNNWTNHFCKLCATIHNVYNGFFQDVTEYIEGIDHSTASFSIDAIESSEASAIKKQNQRAIVLRNLVIFLNQMLVEKYPYMKSIEIPVALNVFKRGLMVDAYDECENSIEEAQFSVLLYDHQTELLYLLRSFIACFTTSLIPFSMIISKIIIDCLQRTEKHFFKNSCKYQEAVYKVLSEWVSIVKNKLNLSIHNKIVTAILIEISPPVNSVVLNLNKNKSTDQAATSRTRKLTKIMTNHLPTARDSLTIDFLKMKEIKCIWALKCCITLLESVQLDLDENNFNALVKTITSTILLVNAKMAEHPYTNADCVVLLYKVLHALLHQKRYCVKPFIQLFINVLTAGENLNFNKEVTKTCNYSLDTLEKLCQPLCPTLSIPIVYDKLCDFSQRTKNSRECQDSDDRGSRDFSDDLNHTNTNSDAATLSSTVTAESCSSTTLIPSEPSLSQSVKPVKKINILDVQTIKKSNDVNEPKLDNMPASLKRTVVHKNKKIIPDKRTSEPVEVNLVKHTLDAKEEPPMKHIRIEADDDDEELMLASFNDSINYQ